MTHATSNSINPGAATDPPVILRTLIAIFDDTIDAEHVLNALRRSDHPPDQISVVLREEGAGDATSRPILARAIASSAVETVSGWLQGLASLILPDGASYLVAGPIGAVLSTLREVAPTTDGPWPASDGEHENPFVDVDNRQLTRALTTFGFDERETRYLNHRVVAGSPLIGATSADPDLLRSVHQTFAKFNAVYLGLAHTEPEVGSAAAWALRIGPRAGGAVVVADAAAPLRRQSEDGIDESDACELPRGRSIVTMQGEEIGAVEDILYEVQSSPTLEGEGLQRGDLGASGAHVPRYIIAGYGGVLGLGRHFVALPAELVNCDADPALARMTLAEAHEAPRYDSSAPLSRLDEVKIREHFKVGRYWLNE
ncbi:MAG: hypothetical protein M3121_07830 [Chloroflexota bacterium]|nr:hypothetical protein [Chloroflexota bacterium]